MEITGLIPNSLSRLKRVSPSRFWGMQACALREVFALNAIPQLLPVSPDARLGSIAHKLFELMIKRRIHNEDSFFENWENEVSKVEQNMLQNPLERHLVPLSNHARNYEVKRQQCLNIIKDSFNHFPTIHPASYRGVKSEIWVESKDKIVGGKIDEVRSFSRETHLIDYKTGSAIDKNELGCQVKMPYQVQMKLYAALYNEAFDVFPDRLVIKTLDCQEYDIPFDKNECLNLLSQVKAKFNEINEIIDDGDWTQLASPSPATCKYCQFRPVCKSYWQARDETGDWNLDVSGVIQEAKVLKNGIRVVIKNMETEIAVRGLTVERNRDLLEGCWKIALFLNLARDTSANFYIEAPLTASFVVRN